MIKEFDSGISVEMTFKCVCELILPGDVFEFAAEAIESGDVEFHGTLEQAVDALAEYGAWERSELAADEVGTWQKLAWVAACDLREEYGNTKAWALAAYQWGMEFEEAEEAIKNGDWHVLTDYEADEMCSERIADSLWVFHKSFLEGHSAVIAIIPDHAWEKMQSEMCEDLNPVVNALVKNVSALIEDAIACNGRGHFLAAWDGREIELNGGQYYAYRCN